MPQHNQISTTPAAAQSAAAKGSAPQSGGAQTGTPQPNTPKRDGKGPPDDRGIYSDHAYGHAGPAERKTYGLQPRKRPQKPDRQL